MLQRGENESIIARPGAPMSILLNLMCATIDESNASKFCWQRGEN